MLIIVSVELISLLDTGVSSNRTNVNHTVAKLDECAALNGDLEISEVVHNVLDEGLVFLFADPFDEGVGGEGDTEFIGCQAVFSEAEVEERGYGNGGRAELFLLFG